jgi:hypothetical protein
MSLTTYFKIYIYLYIVVIIVYIQVYTTRINIVEYMNQFDQVSFFVYTTRINIVETKISYSNVIPHACIDGERKLVHV